MKKRPSYFALLILLFAVGASNYSVAQANKFSAGFVLIAESANAPKMGVWYPSSDAERLGELGPFRPNLAWDGKPVLSKFPLIVLSHGRSGRLRNHHKTSAYLARAGYIVIAPDHHLTDHKLRPPKITAAITARAREINSVLQTVLHHPRLKNIADKDRIAALGYSLGTLTVLYAGGAQPSMAKFVNHCRANYEADPGFCRGGARRNALSFMQTIFVWLSAKGILSFPAEKDFESALAPIDFAAIALVAPIGAPFAAAQLKNIKAPIAIYRLSEDDQLRYPYHAEYLHKTLKNKSAMPAHIYEVIPAHHYAFISELQPRFAEEIDPPEFDRDAFLSNINLQLLNFFNQNL